MKAILVILVVVVLMVLLGSVTFSRVGDKPTVTINTDTVQEDAEQAADATSRAAEKAAAEGERLIDEVQRTDVDVEVHRDRASTDEAVPNEP